LALLLTVATSLAASERQLAHSLLYKAESELSRLQEQTDASLIADMVDEARVHLNGGDYGGSIAYSTGSLSLLELALNTSMSNERSSEFIASGNLLGWDMRDEEIILESSVRAFGSSQFNAASERAQECATTLEQRIRKTFDGYMATLIILDGQLSEEGLPSERILHLMSRVVEGTDDGPKLASLINEVRVANRSALCMLDAKRRIDERDELIDTPSLDSLLAETRAHFEAGNDLTALEVCALLAAQSDDATEITNRLMSLEAELRTAESKGLNVEEPRSLADSATELLRQNRFAQGLETTGEAFAVLEQEISDDLLFNVVSRSRVTFAIRSFVITNWRWLLMACLFVAIVTILTYHQLAIWYRDRRYSYFMSKKLSLADLMRQTQRDYYVGRTMDKEAYDGKIETFQEKLLHIHEQLSLLRQRGAHHDVQSSWQIKRKCHQVATKFLDWIIDWAQRERKHLK
jgi:hypothetical protein